MIACCVIGFRVTTRVSVKVFATVATGLIGLLIAVAELAPTWVEEIAWAIEGWNL